MNNMGTKEVRARLQRLHEIEDSKFDLSNYTYTKSIYVSNWSVGMTVAYRQRPTVKQTVESLAKAGWDNHILYAEPDSNDIPNNTLVYWNNEVLGNWRNFCHRLKCMLSTRTDYLLFVQDDVEFLPDTRQWLEQYWPCNEGIVSLYRSARYSRDQSLNEYNEHYDVLAYGHTFLGLLAVAMTRRLAESLLLNLDALTNTNPQQDDIKLGTWAHTFRIPINIVRQSRCQHIGVTSSVYPLTTTISPSRKADTYVG
jgi:hypothetical protein